MVERIDEEVLLTEMLEEMHKISAQISIWENMAVDSILTDCKSKLHNQA